MLARPTALVEPNLDAFEAVSQRMHDIELRSLGPNGPTFSLNVPPFDGLPVFAFATAACVTKPGGWVV